MTKTLALLFGAVFVLVGILGFIPAVSPNEHLLGIFHVNAAHNAVHLLSGIVAITCGLASERAAICFSGSSVLSTAWSQFLDLSEAIVQFSSSSPTTWQTSGCTLPSLPCRS